MTEKKTWPARGGPGRLPAQEAEKIEDRLLDAAKSLLGESSFAALTMEQVARRAGASTKTLYSRYADKFALTEAVANCIIARSLERAAATAPLDPKLREPREFIIMLGTIIVTGLGGDGAGLIQIALSEAKRFPVIREKYNAAIGQGRNLFQNALEEWHAKGLLPDLTDPPMAAKLLVSMLTDMARIRIAMGEPMSKAEIDAYIPYATGLFLRGLGYRATA